MLGRDPVLRLLVVVSVALLAVHLGGVGSFELRTRLFWVEQVLLDVGFVALCWRVARLPGRTPGASRFWRAFTAVGSFFTAGDLAQAWTSVVRPGADAVGGGTVQTVLVGCGVLLAMWAMLRHPVTVSRRERLRLGLDAATIMTGTAVFVWNFSLAGGPRPAGDVVVTVIGAGLMLVAGFGVVKLVLGNNAPFTRLVGGLGVLSSVLVGLSTGLASALHGSTYLDFAMAARLLPCVLLVAVPRIQELQLRADPHLLVRRRRHSYSRMPYVAAAVTQVLLVAVLIDRRLDLRVWGIVAGVIAVTCLVVIRQLVAFTETDALLLRLRRQEERFRSMVQHASDVTLVADAAGMITYASPSIERVLGVPPARALGRSVLGLVHRDDLPAVRAMLENLTAAPHTSAGVRLRARGADGSWRWLATISTNLLDDPSVNGIICNARDVTDAQELEDRLRFDATHDPLTRLANRALLQQRIDDLSADPERAVSPVAVLAIDLDDFKPVNDSLGHHVGDALLVSVGRRLLSCVRPGDTVARLGGDEFAVFLCPASPTEGVEVAGRILAVLAEPDADGPAIRARASIGVATGPARDAAGLLRTADVAMYEAKQRGKGTVAVARPPARPDRSGSSRWAGASPGGRLAG
jgi:diguanylate cyclase (GGDEF)-like protein/PAS domain S-box-containing protein